LVFNAGSYSDDGVTPGDDASASAGPSSDHEVGSYSAAFRPDIYFC